MIAMSGKMIQWTLLLVLAFSANIVFAESFGNKTQQISSDITDVLWERGESQEAAAFGSRNAFSEGTTWFFLFTGISSCAIAGFIIVRSQKRETAPADLYTIVEDIIESDE